MSQKPVLVQCDVQRRRTRNHGNGLSQITTHKPQQPHQVTSDRSSYMYRLAVAHTSLLINSWHVVIFWYRPGSPIILAALLTSRHVSSSRVTTRTIVPSITSVRSMMRLKDIPRAHSYTTSTIPKRGLLTKSLESLDDSMT